MAHGYDKLASLIGDHPGLSIYRRFGSLAAKNLLYMQAELVLLEDELKAIAECDQQDPQCTDLRTRWEALRHAPKDGARNLQWQKFLEIRAKLTEYYAFLIQTAKVHRLAQPLECDVNFLREWLELPHGGDFFLKGLEAEPWEPDCAADLVALCGRQEERDQFAQYLSDKIVPWYHHHIGHRYKNPVAAKDWSRVWEYRSEIFVVLGNIICMILSALVPTASIVCLYVVKSMIARLAIVAGMSFLFSFVMTVIAQGRRVDVFAATTAFAAVQVVFVGSANFTSNAQQPAW